MQLEEEKHLESVRGLFWRLGLIIWIDIRLPTAAVAFLITVSHCVPPFPDNCSIRRRKTVLFVL